MARLSSTRTRRPMRVRGRSSSASRRAARPSGVLGSRLTASDTTASRCIRGRPRRWAAAAAAAAAAAPRGVVLRSFFLRGGFRVFRGSSASGVGASSSRLFFGTYVGATLRVDRAGGFTGLSAPRVTLRRRPGTLARVPAREPGGSSRDDAGVRGFLEPSHVGDGVGGSSAASGPPRPRGVFGDSTAASDLGFFSLDGSLMSVRYQMPCPGVAHAFP